MNMESESANFTIVVTINGSSKQIRVHTAETTDGVEYYKCGLEEKEITELRNDSGEWKQIWGDLNIGDVRNIGAVIDSYFAIEKIIS